MYRIHTSKPNRLAGAVCIFVIGCSSLLLQVGCVESTSESVKNRILAEHAAQEFHRNLDNMQYDRMFGDNNVEFTQKSRSETIQLFRQIHEILGTTQRITEASWEVENPVGKPSKATLTYNVEFHKGKAEETFEYEISGSHVVLLSYTINSDLIRLK